MEGSPINSNYFIIIKSLSDSVGSDILIKYKTNNQKFACDYIVQKKHISHLKIDRKTAPDSEITIDDPLDKNGRHKRK